METDAAIELIDLPGTYSVHPKAPDEAVTRDALFNPHHPHRPEGSIMVMDAANLKRNLYLTLQVLDLGHAHRGRGQRNGPDQLVTGRLEEALGCPVIPSMRLKGNGRPN